VKRRATKLTPALALEHSSGILALCEGALNHSFSLPPNGPDEDVDAFAIEDSTEVVGVIEIHGPLSQRATDHMCGYSDGYDAIAARFETAMRDDEVTRVVMLIDSPGGDCAGLFDAVEKMMTVKAETEKPVVAYADEMIASAAYALATVADEIYLPRSGQVGSIGCVGIHVDETEAAAKAGLQFTVFRSGPRKMEGNPIEPLTDEAAEAIQERIDALAEQFFEVVAAARGMSVAAVKALEGAMFSGPSAVKKGLADGLATKENVMNGKTKKAAASTTTEPKKSITAASAAKAEDDAAKDELEAVKAERDALRAEIDKMRAEKSEADDDDDGDEEEDDDDDDAPPSSKDGARASAATPKKTARELELEAELHEAKVTSVLDKASDRITPAQRKAYRAYAKLHGIDALKAELAELPKHAISSNPKEATGKALVALTPEERAVAEQLGQTEDQFAAGKAAAIEAQKMKGDAR
jgi:signal peptide peptidase SppA